MRTAAVLAGLALMLGLTVPAVAAEPPGVVAAADEGVGAGGGTGPGMTGPGMTGPGMRAPGHPGGWQRGFGHHHGHRGRSFVGMVLRHRQELGLTAQQVDSLRKLGLDARRAAIRRQADARLAQLDLMSLRFTEPVDMAKIEAKVREIERLRGDGRIAAIRAAEDAKAQLTPEQREKLKSLLMSRWQRRGTGEGGGMEAPPDAGRR